MPEQSRDPSEDQKGLKPFEVLDDVPRRKFRVEFTGVINIDAYSSKHAVEKITTEEFWRNTLLDECLLIKGVKEIL
jgi:hypothetical protein